MTDAAAAVPGAVKPMDRVASLDILRGVALFGVLVVNLITEFRVSIFEQFLPKRSAGSAADQFVEAFVAIGLESKAFCLFALLFGIGLAIQFERFSRLGRPHYWLARRLGALLMFGLAHVLLIWNGDILTEYAIVGFAVLPMLFAPVRWLALAVVALLALYVALPFSPLPIAWPSTEVLQAHVAEANRIYGVGGIAEVWRFSLAELKMIALLHGYVLPRTAALFILGVLVWRLGVLREADRRRGWFAAVALTGVLAGASITIAVYADALRGAFGTVLLSLAPVMMALGYGALVVFLLHGGAARPVLALFAPVGRMAFTNYILQSVVFAFVFFGYGFGQFGKLGAAPVLALGAVVFVGQMALSAWWLARFQFGPLEWVWRSLTYGKAQPLLRKP